MSLPLSSIDTEKLKSIEIVFFDFDGVFTDNYVYVSDQGHELIKSNRSDGLGLSRLNKLGIKSKIISSEKNNVVLLRAKKLKIDCINNVSNKGDEIKKICEEISINPKNAMFVGNDINDIPAFKVVGFSVGVADSFEEIYPYISFITKSKGGQGVVREICDLFHNRYMNSSS